MAFDYTTLTGTKATEGSIRYWANHSLVPAEQVLTEAQAFIFSRLRVREMIASAQITIAAAASTFTLPTRFLEPIRFLPNGWSDDLPFVHENLNRRFRDSDGNLEEGDPSEWMIANELGELDSQLSAQMVGWMWFYQRPADLTASPGTNWLTTRYPALLRHTCTAIAYQHRKRMSDAQSEYALAGIEIEEANRESDRGRRGQTRLR
jgi:hypothetical protein